jgi:hypothetical protein
VRRYLILLLLAALPYQFVWGVAAAYCGHESGTEVSHFGHHTHKHKSVTAQSANDSAPDRASSLLADDGDCGYCHSACAQALAPTATAIGVDDSPRLIAIPPRILLFVMPALIERPDWALTL